MMTKRTLMLIVFVGALIKADAQIKKGQWKVNSEGLLETVYNYSRTNTGIDFKQIRSEANYSFDIARVVNQKFLLGTNLSFQFNEYISDIEGIFRYEYEANSGIGFYSRFYQKILSRKRRYDRLNFYYFIEAGLKFDAAKSKLFDILSNEIQIDNVYSITPWTEIGLSLFVTPEISIDFIYHLDIPRIISNRELENILPEREFIFGFEINTFLTKFKINKKKLIPTFKKGTWMLGGSLLGNILLSKKEDANLDLKPSVGYFLFDRFAILFKPGYSINKKMVSNTQRLSVESSIRYYFHKDKPIYFFPNLSYQYSFGKRKRFLAFNQDSKRFQSAFSLGFGSGIFLSQNIAVESNLYYRYSQNKIKLLSSDFPRINEYQSNIGVSFSFQYYLN